MKKFLLLFTTLLFIYSCSSMRVAKQRADFETYIRSQVGMLSYDEALMNWGKPLNLVEGDRIFVATWGNETVGPRIVMPIGNMWVAGNPRHGWTIQLSFDKKSKKLVAYKHTHW